MLNLFTGKIGGLCVSDEHECTDIASSLENFHRWLKKLRKTVFPLENFAVYVTV